MDMTDLRPSLELRGIRKDFGSFSALGNIDLQVRQGEMLVFLGPSGCGKTTLLLIIAGLESQTAGSVTQNGRDISWLPPEQRDYGIVFQSYALFPNLTVAENVAYGLVNRRAQRAQIQARVAELLTMIGLPAAVKKYPAQLSGGQQQRIALARALATAPKLLLLDEPLSALDAIERVRLRKEIRSLQQQLGVTTIMVTHDQEEALNMADRIVVMDQGAIEQIGTPQEIYEYPASTFVAGFVGKANVIEAVALGGHVFECGHGLRLVSSAGGDYRAGSAVRLYVRPEDRVTEDLCDSTPNQVVGVAGRIEFLGGICLVECELAELGQTPLTIQFSLNQMYDLHITPGVRIRFALRADRIRVFPK
ncbi:putative 2-aminoethylphosphonate ABC transporter ATP-binding protein [Verminephrobacter sp. Larva24]|nr:putative 2-aminoethylphosphonate ABC transporter ATP-binding protein [Verminephrobacter sp. Larva24]